MKRRNQPVKAQKVAQHHNLINARYYLDNYKLKIFNILLASINPDDKEFTPQRIELAEIFGGVGGREYRKIKSFLDDVVSTTVHVEDVVVSARGRVRNNFKTYPLFDEAGYLNGENSFTICFNSKLKKHLLELKNTGCYCLNDLKYLAALNSFYTQRLYWKLRQLYDFKQRAIEYKNLRWLLELDTMEGTPEKYADVSNFKRRVLDVAKNELSKTDLVFDYKFVRNRETKEVETLRITFEKHTAKQAPLSLLEPAQQQIYDRLRRNECSDEQTRWVVFKSGIDFLTLNKICHENEFFKVSNPATNQAARLLKNIKAIWNAQKNPA